MSESFRNTKIHHAQSSPHSTLRNAYSFAFKSCLSCLVMMMHVNGSNEFKQDSSSIVKGNSNNFHETQ